MTKNLKKTLLPLFIASMAILSSMAYGCKDKIETGAYDLMKTSFTDKDIVKDYAICQTKCESLSMFVDNFDRDKICTCRH